MNEYLYNIKIALYIYVCEINACPHGKWILLHGTDHLLEMVKIIFPLEDIKFDLESQKS